MLNDAIQSFGIFSLVCVGIVSFSMLIGACVLLRRMCKYTHRLLRGDNLLPSRSNECESSEICPGQELSVREE